MAAGDSFDVGRLSSAGNFPAKYAHIKHTISKIRNLLYLLKF